MDAVEDDSVVALSRDKRGKDSKTKYVSIMQSFCIRPTIADRLAEQGGGWEIKSIL